MSRNYLIMYNVQPREEEEEIRLDYPNAFVVQSDKEITCKQIRSIFPWDRVPTNLSKIIRFGLKAGDQTFWLDLKDQQAVPLFTASTISLKIS